MGENELTNNSKCKEQVKCGNRKPLCNNIIILSDEDMRVKIMSEDMGFGFTKLCHEHEQELCNRIDSQ